MYFLQFTNHFLELPQRGNKSDSTAATKKIFKREWSPTGGNLTETGMCEYLQNLSQKVITMTLSRFGLHNMNNILHNCTSYNM